MSIGLKYQEIGGGVTKEDVEELCNYDMREKGVKIEKAQKAEEQKAKEQDAFSKQ